jgi:hypothetical protein
VDAHATKIGSNFEIPTRKFTAIIRNTIKFAIMGKGVARDSRRYPKVLTSAT